MALKSNNSNVSVFLYLFSHFLQVEYSKAVSSLRNQKQKVSNETAELASDFDDMQKEVDDLLKNVDEKDSIIQKLQDDLWQAKSLKDNADSERERLIAKMKEKQQHCDSYLEQMEAWRLQVGVVGTGGCGHNPMLTPCY